MKIEEVGKRGFLFTFFELKTPEYDCVTSIYAINGDRHFFICDTYLGPSYAKSVKEYLESRFGNKEYVVFNSHSHWDHIWGNSEFEGSRIIAHRLCREFMIESAASEIEAHKGQFATDKIEIALPNTTFTDRLTFHDEGIEFFYSPGHSVDSASCYDSRDKVLFVGDNIDEPIPYFMSWGDIEGYKSTLEGYMDIDADTVVQSHGSVAGKELVQRNIEYLAKLIDGGDIDTGDRQTIEKHRVNMEFLNSEAGQNI